MAGGKKVVGVPKEHLPDFIQQMIGAQGFASNQAPQQPVATQADMNEAAQVAEEPAPMPAYEPTGDPLQDMMNDPRRRAALEAMAQESQSNYDRLKQYAGQAQASADDYLGKLPQMDPRMPDLTGGANMLNFLFKTDRYGKNYKAPQEIAAEQQAQRQAMLAGIQKQLVGLNDEQRKMFQNRFGDSDPTDLLKMMMTQGRFEKSQATKWSMKDNDDAWKLAKELSGPLGELKTSLETFDQLMPKPGENIPGIGPFERLSPKFMLTERGLQLQQLIGNLSSQVLRKESGLAVTDAERKAILAQLGQSRTSPETALIPALNRIKRAVAETVRQKTAGVRPSVKNLYKQRGGYDENDIKNIREFKTRSAPKEKNNEMERLDAEIKKLEAELGK